MRKRSYCKGCKKPTNYGKYCANCARLRSTFGVVPESIFDLRIAQGYGCKLCQRTLENFWGAVDTDPHSGRVRGLLCARCKSAALTFGTNELLSRLSDYINAESPKVEYFNPLDRGSRAKPKHSLKQVMKFLLNPDFTSMRKRAKALANEAGISPEAAMSQLRRAKASKTTPIGTETGQNAELQSPLDI